MAEIQGQNENAFQKQEAVFIGSKRALTKAKNNRWVKNVGLGFKAPKAAIEGTYIDRKCPFTGNVSIRGKILKGLVLSNKMKRSIVVRRDYLRYVSKYRRYIQFHTFRYEKRHKHTPAHCSPAFPVKEGDIVTIGQCRPLSKTIRFNVVDWEPQQAKGIKNIRKQFRMF